MSLRELAGWPMRGSAGLPEEKAALQELAVLNAWPGRALSTASGPSAGTGPSQPLPLAIARSGAARMPGSHSFGYSRLICYYGNGLSFVAMISLL